MTFGFVLETHQEANYCANTREWTCQCMVRKCTNSTDDGAASPKTPLNLQPPASLTTAMTEMLPAANPAYVVSCPRFECRVHFQDSADQS